MPKTSRPGPTNELDFALDRAIDWAQQLNKPLAGFEALRSGYPWASDRLHRFVLDGMADNEAAFERTPGSYADRHHHPDADITSRLSPYLHFGHVSAHQVFAAVMRHERCPIQHARPRVAPPADWPPRRGALRRRSSTKPAAGRQRESV